MGQRDLDTKTYDPTEVTVIFGGTILTGFAEGDDSISVEPDTDRVTKKTGMKGHTTLNISANRGGKVVLKFQRTALANQVMQDALNEIVNGEGGIYPLLVKDNNGNDLHKAESSWVMNQSPASYGAESGDTEWTIDSANLFMNLGGNS